MQFLTVFLLAANLIASIEVPLLIFWKLRRDRIEAEERQRSEAVATIRAQVEAARSLSELRRTSEKQTADLQALLARDDAAEAVRQLEAGLAAASADTADKYESLSRLVDGYVSSTGRQYTVISENVADTAQKLSAFMEDERIRDSGRAKQFGAVCEKLDALAEALKEPAFDRSADAERSKAVQEGIESILAYTAGNVPGVTLTL